MDKVIVYENGVKEKKDYVSILGNFRYMESREINYVFKIFRIICSVYLFEYL